MRSSSRKRASPTSAAKTTWSWSSHAPLRGLVLARERQEIVVWDDALHVYVLSTDGSLLAECQHPRRIAAVSAADTLERVAIVGNATLTWLDGRLHPVLDVPLRGEPMAVAVDPHGDYAAVSSKLRLVVVDRTGRTLSEIDTPATYRHLHFVQATGHIIGSAEQGLFACHDVRGNLLWKETMYSTVGGLDVDDAGDAVLLGTYSYGVLRYNADGRRTHTDRWDRTPKLVAVNWDGTRQVVTSLDGYVIATDRSGAILLETPLGDVPMSIGLDPLARFVVLGFETGEVRFLSWEALKASSSANEHGEIESAAGSSPPEGGWRVMAATTNDEAESAILETIGADRVALYTNRKTIRIYDGTGELAFESEKLEGHGRSLSGGGRWRLAATDRRLAGYVPESGTYQRSSADLFEISHLFALADPFEALVVESCDHVVRLRLPGEVLWRQRLPERASLAACRNDGSSAYVLEGNSLLLLGPDGKGMGRFRTRRPTPLLVADAGDGWLTASRGDPVLRRHEPDGSESAMEPLAWEPWSLVRVGAFAVVTASDGRSVLANQQGEIVATSDEKREGSSYFALSDGSVARAYASGVSLFVTTFEGRLLWRRQWEDRPIAWAGLPTRVVVLSGRELESHALPKSLTPTRKPGI
jgi:hypothetical protein